MLGLLTLLSVALVPLPGKPKSHAFKYYPVSRRRCCSCQERTTTSPCLVGYIAERGNLAAHGLPGTKASSSDTAALLAVLKGLTFKVGHTMPAAVSKLCYNPSQPCDGS